MTCYGFQPLVVNTIKKHKQEMKNQKRIIKIKIVHNNNETFLIDLRLF